MGSSEQNDSTNFSLSEPKLCVNGCGFFGTASNMNLCSKCYHDLEKQVAFENPKIVVTSPSTSSIISETAAFSEPPLQQTTRCLSCKKKVGLMGFKYKCGSTFCGIMNVNLISKEKEEMQLVKLIRC